MYLYQGGGVDFVSDPMTATFTAGSTTSSVSFPIVLDNLVEPSETFDVSLMVPSSLRPSITAGSPQSAVVTITDSTGTVDVILNFFNYFYFVISGSNIR